MSDSFVVNVNGKACTASPGETVLQVARREGFEIPTLCDDPRLDPAGACRACLVEIDGQARMQPSCAWPVTPGLKVRTESERIDRHRRLLYSLYRADHPCGADGLPVETGNGNQLRSLVEGTPALELEGVSSSRRHRAGDKNHYIGFDPELCILCARCTRYCDEVEGVNAITLAWRGAGTTVSTAGERGLLDTSCELCGGCVDTCPTGALYEKKAPDVLPADHEVTRTTCGFCGVGCQLDLHVVEGRVVKATSPPPGETVNDGNLCVKGRFAYDFIAHEDRLTAPLVRGEDGDLHEASWEEAIEHAARGLLAIKESHGPNSLGFISSSRCTGEENYLVQKLARAAFSTNNVHQCAAT
jgi:predicted molibdopterin-dependent oxidoreductase YjgC